MIELVHHVSQSLLHGQDWRWRRDVVVDGDGDDDEVDSVPADGVDAGVVDGEADGDGVDAEGG